MAILSPYNLAYNFKNLPGRLPLSMMLESGIILLVRALAVGHYHPFFVSVGQNCKNKYSKYIS
jgi:hypothetical protein